MVDFIYSFNDGAFLEIKDVDDNYEQNEYYVEFIDQDNQNVEYKTTIRTNHWARADKKTYVNWLIKVKHKDNIVFEKKLNFTTSVKNNTHYIRINSASLGDTISWIPYAEEYRVKHNVDVYISTYWNNLFKKSYSNLIFINSQDHVKFKFDKKFIIDYYPLIINDKILEQWDNYTAVDYRTIPIQLIAPNILGLPLVEIDGEIDIPNKPRKIKGKYVVIAIQSTAQLKYWNNPNGWKDVFNYLKNNGYKIVLIDKYKRFGKGNYFNEIPKFNGVINKIGNIDLSDRIIDIKYADMIITISSGLAWVAWALNVPTVMISGFTKPWTEFKKNIKRIHNNNVCNGCWNDTSILFNMNEWLWCPHKKNFECSSSINSIEVIKAIKDIELEKNSINIPNSKGDIVDKVTILKIKLDNIKDSNKIKNVKREYDELKKIMNSISIYDTDEDYKELLKINEEIWNIEDSIRDKERVKEFDEDFIKLARSVYYSNDKRAEIKKRINIKKGSSLIEEKSYSEYYKKQIKNEKGM